MKRKTKRAYTKRAAKWFKNRKKQTNKNTGQQYFALSSSIITRGPISFATLSDGRIAIKFDLT